MKILIGMCHPKDVHFWKNIIRNLESNRHEVKIVAWNKDVTLNLLDSNGYDYEIIGRSYSNLFGKFYDMVRSDFKIYNIANKFCPDIYLQGDPYLAHISKIFGKIHIDYCDTDHARLVHLTTFPFSNVICTPSCFMTKIDTKKHISFDGYSEIAYLHPNYFKPNPSILEDLGLSKNEKLIIIRFVAWGASHDVNQYGFTDKEEFIKTLEKYGRVVLFSENKAARPFEKYRIKIAPENFHHLLYYSSIYIGEGATMAAEAAILGTPAIYINTLRLGYLNELEEKYDLVYNFSDPKYGQKQALEKAIELLVDDNSKNKWQEKKEKMLKEKIDVTKFLSDLIENYSTIIH